MPTMERTEARGAKIKNLLPISTLKDSGKTKTKISDIHCCIASPTIRLESMLKKRSEEKKNTDTKIKYNTFFINTLYHIKLDRIRNLDEIQGEQEK